MGRTVPLYFPGFCFLFVFLFVFVFGVFVFFVFFVFCFLFFCFSFLLFFTHTIVFIFWCCVLIIRHATVNCVLFARKSSSLLSTSYPGVLSVPAPGKSKTMLGNSGVCRGNQDGREQHCVAGEM